MVRRAAIILAVLALAGCPGSTPEEKLDSGTDLPTDAGQADYTFAGCPNLDGPLCPRSQTVLCAVDLIRTGESGICGEDDECALATVQRDCVGLCHPVGVGADDIVEVTARIQSEVDRYCSEGTCQEAPCGAGMTGWLAVCVSGFCQAWLPDAGAPDAQ